MVLVFILPKVGVWIGINCSVGVLETDGVSVRRNCSSTTASSNADSHGYARYVASYSAWSYHLRPPPYLLVLLPEESERKDRHSNPYARPLTHTHRRALCFTTCLSRSVTSTRSPSWTPDQRSIASYRDTCALWGELSSGIKWSRIMSRQLVLVYAGCKEE